MSASEVSFSRWGTLQIYRPLPFNNNINNQIPKATQVVKLVTKEPLSMVRVKPGQTEVLNWNFKTARKGLSSSLQFQTEGDQWISYRQCQPSVIGSNCTLSCYGDIGLYKGPYVESTVCASVEIHGSKDKCRKCIRKVTARQDAFKSIKVLIIWSTNR